MAPPRFFLYTRAQLPAFNTPGPCNLAEHYMLSPEPRFRGVMELIDERKYFTLHAGRQTGKSTSARWLVRSYNAGDTYRALWVEHGGKRIWIVRC